MSISISWRHKKPVKFTGCSNSLRQIIIQVYETDLKWRKLGYLEWQCLFIMDLIFIIGQIDGTPHTPGKEHGILADRFSGIFTKFSLFERYAGQYLSSVSTSLASRLAIT